MDRCCYYGDNTGALIDMAYAKHAAHLQHRATHNHQTEVREAAAIRIKEAQMARNTGPWWILAQHSVPTSVGTGIWAQLQLLLPHQKHAILTNHHCDQQGPLVATHTDIHRRPAGEVDTLRLVGAAITIVYITPTQMRIMAQCDAHHAPFLSDPQWPARRVFQAYLRACATRAGREMPGLKDIDTAYRAFRRQHPRPRPSEHEVPIEGNRMQEEPTPSAEGWTPPTILLLAPNSHKHATRTVQRHHTPWSIPKHNAPETDVSPVRHSDQSIPRTCWHCGPAALDTPWPLLHLIFRHYHTPTAAATANEQAWLSPWFHTVPQDHPAHVAWTQTPTATWNFTNERADPDSVAMEYDRCDPHCAGPQEAPTRPIQHKCPTLRGDKDDKERRQTKTCQKFQSNTGYLFHLMYAYITKGRPDRGLPRLTPRAQAIITQEIGVYAAPLLQPAQITPRTAQGNPVYVYQPAAIARLPIPSDTDIIYFTDASGTKQRTPTVGCASVPITPRGDGLHVEHHTGATIFGVSSHGELRTMADAVTTTPPRAMIRPRNISVVVDATADIHLTRRLADLPSTGRLNPASQHRRWDYGWPPAACTPGRPTHCQTGITPLHIRQRTCRHACQTPEHQPHPRARTCTTGYPTPQSPAATTPDTLRPRIPPNGCPRTRCTQIKTSSTTTPHPSTRWPPHWVTRRAPNSPDASKTPSTPPSTTPPYARIASQHTYKKPDSDLPSNSFPSSPDTTGGTQAARSTSPQDTPNASVATRKKKPGTTSRGAPCTEDELDTLTDCNPTHTIAQHARWPTRSPATQQLATVVKQTEVLEVVRRGLVPTAVYTLLRTHAEDPQATAAHMQRTAIAKTAEQLTYRTHRYLQHAATLPQTD